MHMKKNAWALFCLVHWFLLHGETLQRSAVWSICCSQGHTQDRYITTNHLLTNASQQANACTEMSRQAWHLWPCFLLNTIKMQKCMWEHACMHACHSQGSMKTAGLLIDLLSMPAQHDGLGIGELGSICCHHCMCYVKHTHTNSKLPKYSCEYDIKHLFVESMTA